MKNGFTLLELLVVMAIVGILGTIAFASYTKGEEYKQKQIQEAHVKQPVQLEKDDKPIPQAKLMTYEEMMEQSRKREEARRQVQRDVETKKQQDHEVTKMFEINDVTFYTAHDKIKGYFIFAINKNGTLVQITR